MTDPNDPLTPVETAVPDRVPVARPVELACAPRPHRFGRIPALIDLVLFTLAATTLGILVPVGAWMLHTKDLLPDPTQHLLVLQIVLALLVCLLVAGMLALRKQPRASIGWTADRFLANTGIGIIIWIGIMLLSMAMALGLFVFWPEGYKDLANNRQTVADILGDITLVQIFALCVVVSIYEEVIFRGFVLNRLRHLIRSNLLAVFFTSLVFGGLHIYQGPIAVALVFALGMVLGFVVLWRKSLMPAIVAHFLFNTGMLLLLYFDVGPDAELLESLS